MLRAQDRDEAEKLALQDPVHTTNSSQVTVYEWAAKYFERHQQSDAVIWKGTSE